MVNDDYLCGVESLVVRYTDPVGKAHDALLTAVWSQNDEGEPMMVNLVYVIDNVDRNDQYGRQIERATSVARKGEFSAHGRFFELI